MSADAVLGKTKKEIHLTKHLVSYIKTMLPVSLTRKGILRGIGNKKRSFGLPRKQGGTAEETILRPNSM